MAEKLTPKVVTPKAGGLPHAGNADMPGEEVSTFSVAVDRSADGGMKLTFVVGGFNRAFLFDDAARRDFVAAVVTPHPASAVCKLPGAGE